MLMLHLSTNCLTFRGSWAGKIREAVLIILVSYQVDDIASEHVLVEHWILVFMCIVILSHRQLSKNQWAQIPPQKIINIMSEFYNIFYSLMGFRSYIVIQTKEEGAPA